MQPAEGAFDVARWTADLAADSGTPSNAAALHAGRVTLTRASGHGFLQVCGHAPPAWRTPWIRPGGQIVTDCDQFALTAGVRTPMVSRAAATSGNALVGSGTCGLWARWGRTAVAARWRRCLTSGRHRWRCHRRGRVAHVLALPGRHHHTGPLLLGNGGRPGTATPGVRPAVAGHRR